MFCYRYLAVLLLLTFVLVGAPTQAQDSGLAIVILDVFESSEPVSVPESHTSDGEDGPNCAFDMAGHDSYQYGGDSNAARFYSAGLKPFQDPHGRLIFSEYQSLLRELGATLVPNPGLDPMHDPDLIQVWEIPEVPKNIYLIGVNLLVDDIPYQTEEIVSRVQELVESSTLYGIDFPVFEFNPIIFSMSFGLMPCNKLTTLTLQDYLDELDSGDYGDLPELFNSLVEERREDDTPLLSGADLIDILRRPEFGRLHANVVSKVGIQRRKENLGEVYPDVLNTYPPFLNNDPLLNYLSDSDLSTVVAIASSGNDGEDFPYAPALAASVLSVTTEYENTDLNPCIRMLGISTDVLQQQSSLVANAGEVQQFGFYNCMPGTSFAVPRMGIEMAIYLLKGGSPVCNSTNPALAYMPDWTNPPTGVDLTTVPPTGVNLTREAAATEYCPDFNTLVEEFYDQLP
jgi:hypothetical protein